MAGEVTVSRGVATRPARHDCGVPDDGRVLRQHAPLALVEAVRYVGVAVAVFGALITARSGVRVVLDDVRRAIRTGRDFVLRHIPWYHLSVTIHPAPISASASMSGNLTVTATGSAWPENGPMAEQIEVLRKRTERLATDLARLRTDNTEMISSLRAELNTAKAERSKAVAAIRQGLDRREQQAAQIDAGGLPLIAIGIVLLGLPDQAVKHWYVSVPLLP
jgi:hypothetical protein